MAAAFDRICVFAGSAPGTYPAYRRAAKVMGETLAERGIEVVYGGAKVGLMGVVADAALGAGGRVTGIIPDHLVEAEVAHQGLSDLRVVGSLQERKSLMAELADAFVSLPGGLGTIEEALQAATATQLGLAAKPCGVLNIGSFFDPLLIQLDRAMKAGFLSEEHREILVADDDPGQLLDRLEAWSAPPAKYAIEETASLVDR